MQPYIRKGVPPLFIQIIEILENTEKMHAFETLLEKYENNIKSCGKLCNLDQLTEKEPPTTLVWLSYLIAQYFNFKKQYEVSIILNFTLL